VIRVAGRSTTFKPSTMTPNPKLGYAREKLSAARRALMLPHPKGESESVATAFHECHIGLDKLAQSEFDESARDWVRTIQETMDTTGIQDPGKRGTWTIRAESLTDDQKAAFSHSVDELCYWLDSN
jgi:hypothetical protein